MGVAATLHSEAAGWLAEARHEVDVLDYLAGVPGVVACRELIITEDDAVHIVLEYDPRVTQMFMS